MSLRSRRGRRTLGSLLPHYHGPAAASERVRSSHRIPFTLARPFPASRLGRNARPVRADPSIDSRRGAGGVALGGSDESLLVNQHLHPKTALFERLTARSGARHRADESAAHATRLGPNTRAVRLSCLRFRRGRDLRRDRRPAVLETTSGDESRKIPSRIFARKCPETIPPPSSA